MKLWRRLLLVLVAVALAAAGLFFYLRPQPVLVSTREIARGTFERTVVNTRAGTVKACRRALISPAVGGQIATWPVKEGLSVKKGELLLELWNADLRAQLRLAESEAEAAQASSAATCLQADNSQRQFARYLPLKEINAVTEEQLDNLASAAQIAKAQCLAAQEAAAAKRNAIALIQANFDRTLLHAPFDGIIAQLNGELGEYVTPSPPGIQTLPAVDLIDVSCYYVSAPIDEVDVAAIEPGMEVRILLDAFQDRAFAGQVSRIADYVLDLEKQARTVEIEVAFINPEETPQLLPGLSADTEIMIEAKPGVLLVPTEAVLDGNRLYIFNPTSHRLEERLITVGLANWDYTEALAGVRENELVVVTVDRPGMADGARAKLEKAGDE